MRMRCPECGVQLAVPDGKGKHVVLCGRCRARIEIIHTGKSVRVTQLEDKPAPVIDARSCRKCGCAHSIVLRTYPGPSGRTVRRRECRNCGHRFTTFEVMIGHVN